MPWGSPTRRSELGGQLRLALFVNALDDSYSLSIVRGVLAAANDTNSRVIAAVGGVIEPPDSLAAMRNYVYELFGRNQVDGLLVEAASLSSRVGIPAFETWLKGLGVPVSSIGAKLQAVPSFIVDNAQGLHEALGHLIERHGYRRIAFIGGPAANAEARERLQAYVSALKEHGIDVDDKLILEGNFERMSGVEAVRALFDRRGANVKGLQAIVAANDAMALGALDELQKRGIAVPEQVALVGFDDAPAASVSNPPLTTIRQPIVEQSYAALQDLVGRIRGRDAPLVQSQPTRLVVRRSCGCNMTMRTHSMPVGGPTWGVQATLVARRSVVLAELARAARGTFVGAGPGWEGRLLDRLMIDITNEKTVEFATYVETVVRRLLTSGSDTTACNDVLGVLREYVLSATRGDADAMRRAHNVLDDARVAIGEIRGRAEAEQRIEMARRVRELVIAIGAFVATASERAIADAAAACFPKLGIPLCCLMYCENPKASDAEARPVFALIDSECRTGLAKFPVRELFPSELGEGRTDNLAVYPIYFDRRFIGFSVQSLDSRTGFIYETLREIFGMVLNTAALTSRIRELEATTTPAARAK